MNATRTEHALRALFVYFCTTAVCFAGVASGSYSLSKRTVGVEPFARWDANWYADIAERGYFFVPWDNSSVVFFPLYPLLGRVAMFVTGFPVEIALLAISHVSLASSFVFFQRYLTDRGTRMPDSARIYAVVAFGVAPATFFWRMAYSESLFLLVSIAAMYGMQRRWPPVCTALVIGLATATRPVGVALLLPFAYQLLRDSSCRVTAVRRLILLIPLACWGLAMYMLYQLLEFGNAFVFAQGQEHWRSRPPVPTAEKFFALLRLEPIWSVYCESSPAYWRAHLRDLPWAINLQWANPLYFVATLCLTALGAYKRWMCIKEVLLCFALLAIPYVTRSYEMSMASHARFASIAFPAYIVLGELLYMCPRWLSLIVIVASALMMATYSALFAAGYMFI